MSTQGRGNYQRSRGVRGGYNSRGRAQYRGQREHHHAGEQPQQKKKVTVFMPRPTKLDWSKVDQGKILIISFDIETAFGNELSEIYQIGAFASESDKVLVNILPVGNIHWGVTKFAGTNVTTCLDRQGRKILWHNKEKREIESVDPFSGFQTFVTWLEFQKEKCQAEKLVLVAHGNLDAPCMLNNLSHYGLLDRFMKIVDAFSDSMPILNNKLAAVFERLYPGQSFDAHNALADAEALHKILLKKWPSKDRVMMTEEIRENSTSITDSLGFAQYRVSKLAQNLSPVEGVVLHKSLVTVSDLANVLFKNSPDPAQNEAALHVNIGALATFVAFDVQFMHSQGLRSEIVEISAHVVGCDATYHVICYGQDEQHLSCDKEFKSVENGLIGFIEYLEANAGPKAILTAYNVFAKKWPGLVNHCYFYNLMPRLLSRVRGVCDLKAALGGNAQIKQQLAKCDTLEKVHKQLFNESIEAYRSKEVLDSTVKLIDLLTSSKGGTTWAYTHALDAVAVLPETKTKLDASLGDDIAQGRYYPEGHICQFRLPKNYLDLPESCN